MWLANFEDGSSISAKQTFWTQLPRVKKMSAIMLRHPHLPNLYICLADYDKFYFVTEAIAFLQGESSKSQVVAEIIGGVDEKLGIIVENRLDYKGLVKTKVFPIAEYKYSKEIWVDGAGKKANHANVEGIQKS